MSDSTTRPQLDPDLLAQIREAVREEVQSRENYAATWTPDAIREIGYDIADHLLDGLLVHLIKADVLRRESGLACQISADWQAAVEQARSEASGERVELLTAATLGLSPSRRGRRLFTDFFNRHRDSGAEENGHVAGCRRDLDGIDVAAGRGDRADQARDDAGSTLNGVAMTTVVEDMAHGSSPCSVGVGTQSVGDGCDSAAHVAAESDTTGGAR